MAASPHQPPLHHLLACSDFYLHFSNRLVRPALGAMQCHFSRAIHFPVNQQLPGCQFATCKEKSSKPPDSHYLNSLLSTAHHPQTNLLNPTQLSNKSPHPKPHMLQSSLIPQVSTMAHHLFPPIHNLTQQSPASRNPCPKNPQTQSQHPFPQNKAPLCAEHSSSTSPLNPTSVNAQVPNRMTQPSHPDLRIIMITSKSTTLPNPIMFYSQFVRLAQPFLLPCHVDIQ